eukprot:TRINITY_DN15956_c0_g1_i1.p1 TRINITY_DN15956_c0_g1~~TRINITY_DN15956_c0_g1_i1.p1  ORF type:complete len:371 (+),score=80.62 TRINITY_DN15956_c0_g1_i1:69-1181(+)
MTEAGQGTIAAAGRFKINEDSLEKYLAASLPGFAGRIDVKKFGYGQSNPTYLLSTSSGQKYVMRKKPPGKLIKGAHAVDREYRIIRSLGEAGFEVPRAHLLCENGNVIGTDFYVMDFVQGIVPDNGMQKLPQAQRRPAMVAMVRTLAKLHSYEPAKLGLLSGDKPYGQMGGFYKRQISTLKRTSDAQVKASQDGAVPQMGKIEELLKKFEANMPEDISCVIHGDYKPDNVIFAAEGPARVLAVLDWELSTLGHPMSDLANMCLPYYLEEGNPINYAVFDTSEAGGVPPIEEVHRAYCEAAGLPYPIANWSFYVAFAFFRLSVIAQGIASRASRGQASGASANMTPLLVHGAEFLCNSAFDIMSKVSSSKL